MISMRRDRAFTLLELIMTILISSIVMLAIYYGVVYFFGQISRVEERAELRDEADIAARWIEQNTREATWAYVTSDAEDALFAEKFRSGNLQWANHIYANTPNLMVESNGNTKNVASNLQSLNFSVYPSRVDYRIVAERDGVQYALSSSVRLRNPVFRGIWHFSRASGRVAYDDSSHRNHALITGTGCTQVTPSASDWNYGDALAFDGSGDHLRVPSNDGLDTEAQVSVSAWVKLNPAAAADMGNTGTRMLTILNRNGESVKPGGILHVYMESGDLCYAFCDSGVNEIVRAYSDTVSWQADKWYLLLVQHNQHGGEWVKFYRNGNFIGGESVEAAKSVTNGDLTIGAYEEGGTVRGMWEGVMDEVRYSTF